MKKVGLLLFVLLCAAFLAAGVSAQTFLKSDYLQKVETKVDITSAYTHYRVCNPSGTDYSISSSADFSVSFNELKGDLTSYRFTRLESVPYQVDDFVEVCENETVEVPADLVNKTEAYNTTVENCRFVMTGSHTEYRDEWVEFNPVGKTFSAEECYDIKVEGFYSPAHKDQAISIDNIISYAGYEFDEYDWWDVDWQKKHEINVSAPASAPFRPFKLVLNSSYIDMSICQADGGDVRIVNSTNGTVVFNLSSWNATEGIVYINESVESNTTFYLYCNTSTVQNTTSIAIPELELNTGLNGFWKLNQNADDALGLLDGNVTGATANTSCKVDGCYNFDGSGDKIDYSGDTLFDITDTLGISAWINVKGLSDGSEYIIHKGDENYKFSVKGDGDNRHRLRGWIHDGVDYRSVIEDDGGGSITENTWTHVFMRYDRSRLDLYINGSVVKSAEYSGAIRTDAEQDKNVIGADIYGAEVMYGSIDAVGLWNASLPNASIYALWNNNAATTHKFYASPSYTVGQEEEPPTENETANETEGRTAIETGITNALVSGYTIYTDQQIYSRHTNTSQMNGTFDKFVTYNNKRWAFNYDNETDNGFTHMFNLTPVLYVLEVYGMSESSITTMVEEYVNYTK